MRLRLHRFLASTRAEGPGVRACLWVQGCPIHCPGCSVPWTWPADGGFDMEVAALAGRILAGPEVEGVTFLGGEPFAQAAPLAHLAADLRAHGLSVLTFTGYMYEKLKRSRRQDWHDLLAVTDLLIDGPYRRALTDLSRPWIGSANQRFHFLSGRYGPADTAPATTPNRLEIRIRTDGEVLVNGLARVEDLHDLFERDGLVKRLA